MENKIEVNKVGKRGILFTFQDLGMPTNVYAINGKDCVYIIDTYLGPEIMHSVDDFIKNTWGNKSYIVINTHSHWDHVWGNCYFQSETIISHELCRKRMEQVGEKELQDYSDLKKGEVLIKYPNLVFNDRINFPDDNILIYYTPGHMEDGISVYDSIDKVLYVGDNVESPLPYISWENVQEYARTLQQYLDSKAEIIIGGHTGIEDKNIIEKNLDYISKVIEGNTEEFQMEEYENVHKVNMEWLQNHTK